MIGRERTNSDGGVQVAVPVTNPSQGANILSIYALDLKIPTAIVMGGEGKGMRDSVQKECDYVASIPINGQVESLNVSVAAGVVLYEVIRQRGT